MCDQLLKHSCTRLFNNMNWKETSLITTKKLTNVKIFSLRAIFWTRTSRLQCTLLHLCHWTTIVLATISLLGAVKLSWDRLKRKEKKIEAASGKTLSLCKKWVQPELAEGLEESNMLMQACVSNLYVVLLRKTFTVTAALCYAYQGPHSVHMQTEWYYSLSHSFLQIFFFKQIHLHSLLLSNALHCVGVFKCYTDVLTILQCWSLCICCTGDKRDHSPDDGEQGILQPGEAWRVHQPGGHLCHRGHDPPWRWSQWHPAAPQASLQHLQLHPAIQQLHRQGLPHHRRGLVHQGGNVWLMVCVCVCINRVFHTIGKGWFIEVEMFVLCVCVCVSTRFSTWSERGGSSRWECVSYDVCVWVSARFSTRPKSGGSWRWKCVLWCVCINKVFHTIREGWFIKVGMCVLWCVCMCMYQQGFPHHQRGVVHEAGNVCLIVCVFVHLQGLAHHQRVVLYQGDASHTTIVAESLNVWCLFL